MGKEPTERKKITEQELCKQLLSCRVKSGLSISHVDLSGIEELFELDMQGVSFYDVSFAGVRFDGVKLDYASFKRCDFTNASMDFVTMTGSVWENCEASKISMFECDAPHSTIENCNFNGARIRNGRMMYSTFSNTDLRNAQFTGTDVRYASLVEAETEGKDLDIPIACPERGSFTAFKKVVGPHGNVIAELIIPARAIRCSATSNKCRASEAKVVRFWSVAGTPFKNTAFKRGEVHSCRSNSFKYNIGETVKPICPFEPNRWKECSSGIHFFMRFKDAAQY